MRSHFIRLAAFAVPLAGLVIVAGCNTAQVVSTDQEVAVGRQAAQQVESEHRVITGTDQARRVNTIGNRIIAQKQRSGVDYKLKLLDTKDVNAIALPGGWMYVYRGLLDFIDKSNVSRSYPGGVTKDDILANIVAHELAHIEKRHHAQMMGRGALYDIAIGALTDGNTAQWANLFANVHMLQYSRSHENESDSVGMRYAKAAGYNPYGMVAFLELLQAGSRSGGGDLQEMLSTHPAPADRVERTRQLAKEISGS